MKFLNYTKVALVALTTLVVSVSCSDDEEDEKIVLTVKAQAPTTDDQVSDYSSLEVKLSSQRDGKVQTAKLSSTGETAFTVDKGSYEISVDGLVDGKNYSGTTGVAQYATTQTVTVNVQHIVTAYSGSKDGLVFTELFYNGGKYEGSMMHPDQYVVIGNNSVHDIYCDSLVISVASRMNTMPCSTLTDLLPDFVVVASMYMIPGNGTTYKLAPGEQYVIAASAINHTEGRTYNADTDSGLPVDLSGADFELADEDASFSGKVTDNPEVPNLVKVSNNLPKSVSGTPVTAWMHPYGIRPVFMFDGSGIDWSSFKAQNKVTYNDKITATSELKELHGYKIPTRLIVDGVETTSATTPKWQGYDSKSLPAQVDKSYVQATITTCHASTFMYRVQAGSKWQDTNDSSSDMKIETRKDFKGYPKK